MTKSSNLNSKLEASLRRCKADSKDFGEWTYEGGRKRELVVTDGAQPLYCELYVSTDFERMSFSSIRVAPQDLKFKSCPLF